MPAELARRLIRLYSCVGDVVLDPFSGSGTTLREAKLLKRNFIGYELYENYKPLIEQKLGNLFDFE
ncbi:DNA methylase family protein [Helicobacter pylori Hp H-11]|nr:DNA methylase family protein [Helicobacter pylori Hp H-11]PDX27313.1 DNA methylase [Helicobacter pylori]